MQQEPEPALEPEPEPEPEPEGPPGPMAAFDEAAVQAWLAAVPGLAAAQVPPDAHRHRTMRLDLSRPLSRKRLEFSSQAL